MFDNLSPNMKAAIFTAAVGVLGGGGTWLYNMGYGNGARDIADVRAFQQKLPQTLDDLDKLAKALVATEQMIDDNKRLAKEKTDLVAANSQLQEIQHRQKDQLTTQATRIAELEAGLAKAFPPAELNVSIAAGAAARVIPNLLTIGVDMVYPTDVTGYINGSWATIRPGEPQTVQVADRTCTIELMLVKDPASFVVTCNKK